MPSERISKTTGWLMIGTAGFIDALEAILGLVLVGEFVNSIISICADLAFGVWFWTKGLSFTRKPRNLAAMGTQVIIGAIPILNLLPELTVAVIIIVRSTQKEDREMIGAWEQERARQKVVTMPRNRIFIQNKKAA